jgi:hypothetical protein
MNIAWDRINDLLFWVDADWAMQTDLTFLSPLRGAARLLLSTSTRLGRLPSPAQLRFGTRRISGRRAPLIARRNPQLTSLLQSPKGAIGTPWSRSRMPSSYTPPWSLRSVLGGVPDLDETVSSTAATEQLATSCSLAGAWPLGSL